MDFDTIILSALIPAVIVLIIMCLLSCLRCGKGRKPAPTSNSNVYVVPANYNAVNSTQNTVYTAQPASSNQVYGHRRISSVGDRFMVPLELLPPNFDFNAPGVQYKGDHVLVKDLRLIEMHSYDEYQKQSPYNPNFA